MINNNKIIHINNIEHSKVDNGTSENIRTKHVFL